MNSSFLEKENLIEKAQDGFLPHYVTIPLCQEDGMTCTPCVQKGQRVEEGQVIARPDSTFGAAIHSSIPGVVAGIGHCSVPNGHICSAVKIRLEGSFSFLAKNRTPVDYSMYPTETLKRKMKESGIINTFFSFTSLASDIQKAQEKNRHLLIARLFSPDPSVIVPDFLSKNYMKNIVIGCGILSKLFSCNAVVFATTTKEYEKTIDELAKQYLGCKSFVLFCSPKTYPRGDKETIIKNMKKQAQQETLSKDLSQMTKEDLFVDDVALLAVYDAIVMAKPVIDTFVHITGEPLVASGIFKTKIGTPISFLTSQCGSFAKKPKKIIINGLMNGFCVPSLDIPVTKYVHSIQFLSGAEDKSHKCYECIRCGECRNVCPEGIFPDVLYRHWTKEFIQGDVIASSALLCSSCNLCGSICPARLPLSQAIDLLKKDLRLRQQ